MMHRAVIVYRAVIVVIESIVHVSLCVMRD